jgi:hypothetical protein
MIELKWVGFLLPWVLLHLIYSVDCPTFFLVSFHFGSAMDLMHAKQALYR